VPGLPDPGAGLEGGALEEGGGLRGGGEARHKKYSSRLA
jgi:hypothetical protein